MEGLGLLRLLGIFGSRLWGLEVLGFRCLGFIGCRFLGCRFESWIIVAAITVVSVFLAVANIISSICIAVYKR